MQKRKLAPSSAMIPFCIFKLLRLTGLYADSKEARHNTSKMTSRFQPDGFSANGCSRERLGSIGPGMRHLLLPLGFLCGPQLPQAPVKGGVAHAAKLAHLFNAQLTPLPAMDNLGKIHRQGLLRASKAHAPCFSRRDALLLALADVSPLVLSHKGEQLQDYVGDKSAD